MADVNDLFITGDDFDAILEILENDEMIEEQFTEAVSDVQLCSEIVCGDCGKKYKTKGGFERHRVGKHNAKVNEESKYLNAENLKDIVNTAITKVTENVVFAKEIRDELKNYTFELLGATELTDLTLYQLWLLITTQDTTSIPLTSSSIQHISVSEGMHPDDASSLLRLLSGVTDSEMEKQIAKALNYQPLALASAATYVRQMRQNKAASKFGWGDYLTKLEKGQRSGTETILAETNPSYQKSMTTAITLAVEKVMTSDKVIHHMFTCLSVCSPQPIHQDIVINYIMGSIDEEVEDEDTISTRMNRCSLLLFEEEESGFYIRVHEVVYDVINTVTADYARVEQLKAVLKAVTSFSQFLEEDISKNGYYRDPLAIRKSVVPHLTTLIIKLEELLSNEGKCVVAERGLLTMEDYAGKFQILGRMCDTHCEFHSALKYFKMALKCINQRKLLDNAVIYIELGNVHCELGDKEQAKDYYSRALDMYLVKVGPDHVDVARTYNNLGVVQRALGDKEKAKDYYSRALDIYLKKLGPDHVDVATTYNNLGAVYSELGDNEQAKDYFARALDIRLKKLGPDHVDVARIYNNLGVVHDDKEQAKDCYDLALTIYVQKLGPNHVNVINIQTKLAQLQQTRRGDQRCGRVRKKENRCTCS